MREVDLRALGFYLTTLALRILCTLPSGDTKRVAVLQWAPHAMKSATFLSVLPHCSQSTKKLKPRFSQLFVNTDNLTRLPLLCLRSIPGLNVEIVSQAFQEQGGHRRSGGAGA